MKIDIKQLDENGELQENDVVHTQHHPKSIPVLEPAQTHVASPHQQSLERTTEYIDPAIQVTSTIDLEMPFDELRHSVATSLFTRLFIIACGIVLCVIGGQYLYTERQNSDWNSSITFFSIIIVCVGVFAVIRYTLPLLRKVK